MKKGGWPLQEATSHPVIDSIRRFSKFLDLAMVGINDIPFEILEYILYLVSPYDDIKSCQQVSLKLQVGK